MKGNGGFIKVSDGGSFRMPLFLVLGAALLVARRPEMLTKPEMYAESAPVFYIPTFFNDPASLLTTPYAGYLHLLPRLVAWLDRLVAPDVVPMVEAAVSIIGTVLIAGFIASERLSSALPRRRDRYLLATMILVTPSAREVVGIEVNLQVAGAAYLVALSVAHRAETLTWRVVDAVGATLASLSGPFAIFLLPLFWLRRSPNTMVVTACVVIQLAVAINTEQRSFTVPAVGDLFGAIGIRITAAVLGPAPAQLLPHGLALLILALLVLAIAHVPPRRWLPFAYAACAVGGMGLFTEGVAAEVSRNALSFERFFFLAPIAVTAGTLAGIQSARPIARRAGQVLGVLLLSGVLLHLRVPGLPDGDWPRESACIGSQAACVIEVVPRRFSLTWPGAAGEYPAPQLPSEVVEAVLTD